MLRMRFGNASTKTGLSSRGFTKAEVIRSLENVLRALENGRITAVGTHSEKGFRDP